MPPSAPAQRRRVLDAPRGGTLHWFQSRPCNRHRRRSGPRDRHRRVPEARRSSSLRLRGILRVPLGRKLPVEVDQVPMADFLRNMLHRELTRAICPELRAMLRDGAINA